MQRQHLLLAALALASSAFAAQAGTAEVKFIDPDSFTDLATNRYDEPDTMKAIASYLDHLAARLPPSQVLHVEVLDVDLAGTWRDTPRGRIRTVRNRADPPKFHLRWTLEENGQALRSGDDRISDIDYTNHLYTGRTSTPLYYEKRLLDQWFARTFVADRQAYAR